MKKKQPRVVEEVLVNNSDKHQEELTNRLKHYNEWLMDNTRDMCSTYPGYPGDSKKKVNKLKELTAVTPLNYEKGTKMSMKIEAVGVKVSSTRVLRGAKTGTKQSKAYEIVQRVGTSDKSVAVEAIMTELNMSKAGATTYFHNAKTYLASQTNVTA